MVKLNVGTYIFYFESFKAFIIKNLDAPFSRSHMIFISGRNLVMSITPNTAINNRPKSLLAECS